MNKLQNKILKLKTLDPLSVAEKITGKDYKVNKDTEALGIMLHFEKTAMMKEMLEEAGDTQISNTVTDYLRITTNFGFEVVYTEKFLRNDDVEETLYMLFHKEFGILICFDTFTWSSSVNVNGGKMYYNWSPNDYLNRYRLTSSGSFFFEKKKSHLTLFENDLVTRYEIPEYPADPIWEPDMPWEEFRRIGGEIKNRQSELIDVAFKSGKRCLWSGDHDCREGIITIIKSLFEEGKFFPKWHSSPFHWLTSFMDHKKELPWDDKFNFLYEITEERIKKLPQHVRDCIGDTYRKSHA